MSLHIDYGPCFGKYFLVLIDSHSKWLEVYPVRSTTTAVTIEKLKLIFSIHGLYPTWLSQTAVQSSPVRNLHI